MYLNQDKIGGIQYTPLDMAQYVFWTGDEKGVTSSIEEFLQAGIVGFIKKNQKLKNNKF